MHCLIIDDDPTILSLVASLLGRRGHDIDTSEGLEPLEACPERLDVDLVILDYRLDGATGLDILRLLMTRPVSPAVILLSGAERDRVTGAVALGRSAGIRMLGRLEKPLDARALLRIVDQLQASQEQIASREIRSALTRGHFLLAYQPKLCMVTGRLMGVEALARWQDPEQGLVPPDRFIAVAEQDGQIIPLTWQLVEQALAQQHRWTRAGIRLDLAINLSPVVLDCDDFLDAFLARVERHGVAPSTLTLELTETRGIDDLSRAHDHLTRLRDLGFGIAIDDFGTGNASMLQLYRLPFTQLKLDRAFVSECHTDPKAREIILMVIELASRLGLDVVAEGIETWEQGRMLHEAGCHAGQGYLFARPMYADIFNAWYAGYSETSSNEESSSWQTIQQKILWCLPAQTSTRPGLL